MRKLLLTAYLTALSISLLAADTTPALILRLTDGTMHTIKLSQTPVITISDNTLNIDHQNGRLAINLDQLRHYAFEEVESGIDDIEERPVWQIEENTIRVKAPSKKIDITITSPKGIVLTRQSLNAGEEFEFSLDTYAPGIYLLTIDSFTAKIARQ